MDAEAPEGDFFNPFRVGLDHFALGVENDALEGLVAMLDEVGARNNGIQVFEGSGALYISAYDPDGIAWEFFGKPRTSHATAETCRNTRQPTSHASPTSS